MTSEIMAQVMMGDLDAKIAESRITCNCVSSHRIFCKCGNVLDQKTITVVTAKTPKRRVVVGFCPNCWEQKKDALHQAALDTGTACLMENWDGVIFKQGEV